MQGALPGRGRQHRQLRAALHRRGHRALQPGARRRSRRPEGLRADRQDPDREEGLEEPGARLPQDDQAHRAGSAARARSRPQVALWHALGEIYRSRLKDFQAATAAFEVACSSSRTRWRATRSWPSSTSCPGPSPTTRRSRSTGHLLKAHAGLRRRWRSHIRRCAASTWRSRQYDRAWCVASALVFLRKADAEEQQFYEQYKPKGFVRAKARLTEELWQQNIYHPDEDRYISHVFAAVSQAVAAVARQGAQGLGPQAQGQARHRAPTSCCSARCSTTSLRCWRCRSPSSTCGPSRPASWTWPTRARRRSWSRRSWSARACCRAGRRKSWPTSSARS